MIYIRSFDSVDLHLNYSSIINYASLLNGGALVGQLALKNNSEEAVEDINVKIAGFYIPAMEFKLSRIEPHEMAEIDASAVLPSLDKLRALTEAVYTEFNISVSVGDNERASFRFPLTIHAWNHWAGNRNNLHEIVSFVQPFHPYVAEIVDKATTFLEKRAPGAAFIGDNQSPDDVVTQIRAVWEALSRENLKYLTMNPNYVDEGQRVLMPGEIRRYRHGNCLDLSLLLCACLERVGLMPVLITFPGHIVAGVWTGCVPPMTTAVSTASANIIGWAAGTMPSLMLIESTAMTAEKSLDDAVSQISDYLHTRCPEAIIDIVNSRQSGVRSLPVVADEEISEVYEIKGCAEASSDNSRRQGWERKLLDLTLRNVMLNIRPGKTIVPIWERDVPALVQHLKDGTLATVVGKAEKDNLELLKGLYRAARTSLEENGANSLFVSVGTLRWYDVDDPRPHSAPLLFIPVEIVRKKAMTYQIRMRDGEAMVNVTLLEMLRQMFGITFPEFSTLPVDSDGFPDYRKIFDVFESHVAEINKRQPKERQWELPVESYVGIFSFTKFLMWHDLHFNPQIVDRHPVLHGLIENRYDDKKEAAFDFDKFESEPDSLMLPVDYDSSQLAAVAESHAGSSFVLHGPPGTGKSQTITNMIADAMYSGKRVLFVAEKKAALDVVRSRLNGIGLEPYCLELHSNKTDKRSFFSQIQGSDILKIGTRNAVDSANHPKIKIDNYKAHALWLAQSRKPLAEITRSLHQWHKGSGRLYRNINRYLANRYDSLTLSYGQIEHLSQQDIEAICSELVSLDIVEQIIGYHPGKSGLIGLYPTVNTAENQNAVMEALREMPQAIENARRKARSLLNRIFRRRSAEQYLADNPVWKKLCDNAVFDPRCTMGIDNFETNVQRWQEAADTMRHWYLFAEKAIKIKDRKFLEALDFYFQGHGGEESARAVRSAYYKANAYYIIDNDNALRGFNGALHQFNISQYLEQVSKFRKCSLVSLTAKLQKDILEAKLTPGEEKQLAVLIRRMQSNGRGVALRKIIADSSEIISRLFPCMLMSPLSVAQYLDMKSDMFDLIIFDEASQMETADAVGTIARGKSLVVVGDPMQLPPTRFFTTQTTAGEDVEESEDADSILEDCIALGLPSRYLSRHYRSRHESLIAFSNARFYENKLLTFPSFNDSERKVSLVDPGGVYDYGRTRTNRIEAEAVVAKVLEIAVAAGDVMPSIGVVAFSKAQSNLIEDLLNVKLQRNKALQAKLDSAVEPIFIKNLENVQGDERDIIIFSIGYGPDKDGNVSLNFGPLNQSGGERRLNVAVSRAREEMIVFSSLQSHHIPSEGIFAKGVCALRDFLAYADSGEMPLVNPTDPKAKPAEPEAIVSAIAERLAKEGYEVKTYVGRSDFKVDIAVVDPSNPEKFCLGIILDGYTYKALPTVRDRELTIPYVLRSLGWKIARIWAIDWFENPDMALTPVLEALKH